MTDLLNHLGRAPEGAAHDASRHGPAMRAARIIGMLRPEIGGEDFSTCADAGQGEPVIPLLPPRAAMLARPLPNHPLGDPEQAWREPSRVLLAIMADGWIAQDGPDLLRQCDAAGLPGCWICISQVRNGSSQPIPTQPCAPLAGGWPKPVKRLGEATRTMRDDPSQSGGYSASSPPHPRPQRAHLTERSVMICCERPALRFQHGVMHLPDRPHC